MAHNFEDLYWTVSKMALQPNWKLITSRVEDVDEKIAYAAYFVALDFNDAGLHDYVADLKAYAEGSTANEALINLTKAVRKMQFVEESS